MPFIAVLLGAAFLAEPVRVEQLLGGVVIVLGVAITRSDRVTAFGSWLRPEGRVALEPGTIAGRPGAETVRRPRRAIRRAIEGAS